jgi:hypothetical protein
VFGGDGANWEQVMRFRKGKGERTMADREEGAEGNRMKIATFSIHQNYYYYSSPEITSCHSGSESKTEHVVSKTRKKCQRRKEQRYWYRAME